MQPQPRVEIVHLNQPTLAGLATGDIATANRTSPVPLPDSFDIPDWRGTWQRRAAQVLTDPRSADWITGIVWDPQLRLPVGRAGFHGPPDDAGMVEVGYAIDPRYRRRGYARAALELLLRRATADPTITVVRASISPTNTASYALVAPYGFVEVGQLWDDEDGWETIYELQVPAERAAPL